MDDSFERPFDGIEFRSTRKIALQVTLALAGSLFTIVIMGVSFFLALLSNNPKLGPLPGVIGGGDRVTPVAQRYVVQPAHIAVRLVSVEQVE